jgi:protein-disulfide isomerase
LRFPSWLLPLCLGFAVDCLGQGTAATRKVDRTIEKLVRSQLTVPNNWEIVPGSKSPSNVPGFDNLEITFFPLDNPTHTEKLQLLIAKDGSSLGRLMTWKLEQTLADKIDVAGRPFRGSSTASVVIVNFDDLECPFCARMHAQLFPSTLDLYKGQVKIVYKDDPLIEIHPWAMHAAVDANCLAAQSSGAYWNYVDRVHTHGEDISGPDHDLEKAKHLLDTYAKEEGAKANISGVRLSACVSDQDERAVRSEMKEAAALKIDGTPAVYVNGELLTGGARPVSELWASINRALRSEGQTPPKGSESPDPVTQTRAVK